MYENADNKCYVREVSDDNEESNVNWTRSHLYHILANNSNAFCLIPETV